MHSPSIVLFVGCIILIFSPAYFASAHEEEGKLTCPLCTLALDLFKEKIAQNSTEEEVVILATDFCIDFKIEDKSVCTGIILMFKNVLFSLLEYESHYVCGFLGFCPAPDFPKYNVTFPKPKPPHVAPVPPSPNGQREQILHLTDLHFDALYVEGMNTNCGEPLCCRAYNGPGVPGKTAAGKWGDYNCDMNQALLDSMLTHINSTASPSFLVWTGDNPPHYVWNQTETDQISNAMFLTDRLKQTFPNTPIFPCIGNHEAVPVNEFELPPGESWLYNALADLWSKWLSPDALATFRYGGYYVQPIRAGLKLMSLNMNYCNKQNAWLLVNMTDPGRMLEWMIDQFQIAEDNKERVYVIGHIPSGDSACLGAWGYQYYQVVNRYEDTIIAGFFGHSHNDEFEIYYELNGTSVGTRPTSVEFESLSGTPYTNINSGYRLYTIDSASGYLTEISTYNVDLAAANANGSPNWALEYNATQLYNMSGLFPEDWAALVEEFKKGNYIQEYVSLQNGKGPGSSNVCDENCQKGTICGLNGDWATINACNAQYNVDLERYKKEKVC